MSLDAKEPVNNMLIYWSCLNTRFASFSTSSSARFESCFLSREVEFDASAQTSYSGQGHKALQALAHAVKHMLVEICDVPEPRRILYAGASGPLWRWELLAVGPRSSAAWKHAAASGNRSLSARLCYFNNLPTPPPPTLYICRDACIASIDGTRGT